MGKLDDAEDRCRKAAGKVEATLSKLNLSVARAAELREAEQQKLCQIAARTSKQPQDWSRRALALRRQHPWSDAQLMRRPIA